MKVFNKKAILAATFILGVVYFTFKVSISNSGVQSKSISSHNIRSEIKKKEQNLTSKDIEKISLEIENTISNEIKKLNADERDVVISYIESDQLDYGPSKKSNHHNKKDDPEYEQLKKDLAQEITREINDGEDYALTEDELLFISTHTPHL